ncbi:hypothetical protein EV363DRAFT_1152647 [Boletus edulis]|uniref:MARVEL domain-containing protein n=1 Tax=Boletus edulis BED1 TaxID=1328754 RepID=A0AAD4GJG6_BOLED|nr:hypothetical protein EV363DRAFT_1152647 [Boletus edulis]KAF8445965.1 hypothetical protein L210DRAFT_840806 [Boletus edulis BED1]
MPYIKTHYHPILFVLITICAMAELGLTAFLISAGNGNHNWPSARYHVLLILVEFNAVWTTLFGTAYLLWIVDGAVHFLASIASSIIWLVITTVLWGVTAALMHIMRAGSGCNWLSNSSASLNASSPCPQPQDLTTTNCKEMLSIEAVGWVEFGLCALTLLATCMWLRASKRSYVSESRRLV